ncbi:MAPK regulated corepressor interacting protein 2 isoform X2 [Tachyglossus aculeatus]|uniref:MAPK regulated corepressor interacting protein 2 isoform X2 n=1 Tax=Tachyglossus aculeatus TaxID=9261 RepID=UPI0018F2DF41|nr:MAPK regulated corepressor interacting protein 2 isoform X2 [Tachyglossus aculeatus]
MYTITRGPSKLATQRRTGPSQQQVDSQLGDHLKCQQQQQQQQQQQPPTPQPQQACLWPLASPAPKLVFNRVNGKRPLTVPQPAEGVEEGYALAHEENVRFVNEAWQQVQQQLDGHQQGQSGPVQYEEKTPDPRLKNFVPIDLDEWWAQQFLARITNSS